MIYTFVNVFQCHVLYIYTDEVNKARSVDIPTPNESFSAKSLVEMTCRVKRAESQVEIKEHHMKKLEDECKVIMSHFSGQHFCFPENIDGNASKPSISNMHNVQETQKAVSKHTDN